MGPRHDAQAVEREGRVCTEGESMHRWGSMCMGEGVANRGTSLNNPMGKPPIKGKGPKGKYRPTRENGQTGD